MSNSSENRALRRVRPFGAAAAILLVSTSAVAQAPPTGAALNMVAPNPYSESLLAQGDQWSLVQASGYDDESAQPFNTQLYMLKGTAGIQNSPLPYSVKDELLANADDESTFTVDSAIASEIDQSLAQGYLTPALEAIAEPLDPGTEDPIYYYGANDGQAGLLSHNSSCSDRQYARSGSRTIATPLQRDFDIADGFTGNLSLTGEARFDITGEYDVVLKRHRVLWVCIPYAVRMNHAAISGTGTIEHGTTLTGTLTYAKSWEWELAKPTLFTATFMAGPIPVHIGFTLPVKAGVSFKATAMGSVTYTASRVASGSLSYVCTSGGCWGNSSFGMIDVSPQVATGSVSGRIEPSIFAEVAVRGYLYNEAVAYAQVGVKPYLHGDLWGYYGNNCGDADQDGFYETVDALTFGLDWQVQITGEADTFLTSKRNWTLYDTGRRYIAFWDLNGSSVFTPILRGPASVAAGTSPSYTASMRPCWPYSAAVNYTLSWGDGTSTSMSGAPAAYTGATHTWPTEGARRLDLVAWSDAHGRSLGRTTSRTIQVTAAPTPDPTPITVTYSPMSIGEYCRARVSARSYIGLYQTNGLRCYEVRNGYLSFVGAGDGISACTHLGAPRTLISERRGNNDSLVCEFRP